MWDLFAVLARPRESTASHLHCIILFHKDLGYLTVQRVAIPMQESAEAEV